MSRQVVIDAALGIGLFAALVAVVLWDSSHSRAPRKARGLYNMFAGRSVIAGTHKDKFGNPVGSQYDLGRDGAFEGLQIAVLHLYTGGGFDFKLPQQALEVKGFSIHRWKDRPPEASELKRVLAKSCQLWIISDQIRRLNEDHLRVIKKFFESGRGVYVWGDVTVKRIPSASCC